MRTPPFNLTPKHLHQFIFSLLLSLHVPKKSSSKDNFAQNCSGTDVPLINLPRRCFILPSHLLVFSFASLWSTNSNIIRHHAQPNHRIHFHRLVSLPHLAFLLIFLNDFFSCYFTTHHFFSWPLSDFSILFFRTQFLVHLNFVTDNKSPKRLVYRIVFKNRVIWHPNEDPKCQFLLPEKLPKTHP